MDSLHVGPHLSIETIRGALKIIVKNKKLEQHSLCQLRIVKIRSQEFGEGGASRERAIALRHLLREGIYALKPAQSEPDWLSKQWRSFIILNEQYLKHRKPDWIMAQLHISRTCYYNEQKKALAKLAHILGKWELYSSEHNQFEDRVTNPTVEFSEIETGQYQSKTFRPVMSTRIFVAPPQSDHELIGRSLLYTHLKNQLLSLQAPDSIALYGLPGIGKTALALDLVYDRDVQNHFADGILWSGLDAKSDALPILGSWARILGVSDQELSRHRTLSSRRALVQAAAGQRKLLIVLDNVQDREVPEALKLVKSNCTYLLTTCRYTIAVDFAGQFLHKISELMLHDGVTLLARLAPSSMLLLPGVASTLVRAAGGMPRALTLLGKLLRQQVTEVPLVNNEELLHFVQQCRAQKTSSMVHALPGMMGDLLRAALHRSCMSLSPAARDAWHGLSLFPQKPNTFSESAALAVTGHSPLVLAELLDYGLMEHTFHNRLTLHPYMTAHQLWPRANKSAQRRYVTYFGNYSRAFATDYEAIDREWSNIYLMLRYAIDEKQIAIARQVLETLRVYLSLRGYGTPEDLLQQLHPSIDFSVDFKRKKRAVRTGLNYATKPPQQRPVVCTSFPNQNQYANQIAPRASTREERIYH